MLELTFLEADRPLRKSYSLDSQRNLAKESYPSVWEFTSHVERVENAAEFCAALSINADLGRCLLKGNTNRPLVAESRAGSTDPNAPTQFACFDFDRAGQVTDLGQALQLLGLNDVTRIDQYSASYGVERSKGLTAHSFFLLDRTVSPSALKQWLIHLNLTTPWLRALCGLTKTNNAISWPLDISTCQNDKLIYIAGPHLGKGVTSVFEGPRIQLVEKAAPLLSVQGLVIPPAEQNRIAANELLDELRAKGGLPSRKWSFRVDKTTGLEVLAKPDASTLTGVKNERGFTYFNLNGGNSWGYYHPNESPEVIRNFKGETNYSTSELLPEYWEQVLQARKKARHAALDAKRSEEELVLAFRDFKSAAYYNGTFKAATNTLELARAASETQLQHFLLEHGAPPLESIPIWNLEYRPNDLGERVQPGDKSVNLFCPTKYMVDSGVWASTDTLSGRCPAIYSILGSAVGRNPALQDHFLNWTACVVRHRVRTLIAWLLQGVEGTGKGILVNRVLKPLLGIGNVAIKRMAELEDNFNGYVENSLLVVIDEAQVSGSKKAEMIMANLKHQITEPEVSIRKMYTASYSAPNYCNFLFLSNMDDPVVIGATDRRFNCGEYGKTRFIPSEGFFESLEAELPSFAAYLHWREADLKKAGAIFESADRDLMKAISTNSLDATAQALIKGDLEFFWDNLPAGDAGILGAEAQALNDTYTKLVHDALRAEHGVQRLTRDELRVFFAYNVGEVSRTPAKFASLLRHHRINLEPVRASGRVVRGLEVRWKTEIEWTRKRLEELNERVPALRKVA